jgi:hypothetical protein
MRHLQNYPPIDEARIAALLWKAALLTSALLALLFLVSLVFITRDLQHLDGTTDPVGFFDQTNLIELWHHRAVWLFLCVVAGGVAWLRRWPAIWLVLICVIAIELVSLKAHRLLVGGPFRPLSPLLYERFVYHPLLQVVPKPGSFGIYTHTADNLRVTVNSDKAAGAKRISAYGGSTTYEFVKDAATWSSVLSALLGPNFFVENHGVPGYSTVEHIVQASFDFRDRPPKCALFYLGWNDIRSSHTDGLRPDYSNFHLLKRREDLGLDRRRSLPVRRSAFLSLIQAKTGGYSAAKGKISSEYDPRLSKIFRDNVRLIATISRHFGVDPIFIPQVLNYDKLTAPTPTPWMPFVREADAKRLMGLMNADLKEAARESEAPYLGEVLQGGWEDGDFVDNGHFSEAGSRKFAGLIAGPVAQECH